jgi:hypothetical protein
VTLVKECLSCNYLGILNITELFYCSQDNDGRHITFIEYRTTEAGGATVKAINEEVAGKCWFADSLYMTSHYLLYIYTSTCR